MNALIDQGLAERVEGGIMVRAELLHNDIIVTSHRKNVENLSALFSDLRDGGFNFS